jgi:hypothetical protein
MNNKAPIIITPPWFSPSIFLLPRLVQCRSPFRQPPSGAHVSMSFGGPCPPPHAPTTVTSHRHAHWRPTSFLTIFSKESSRRRVHWLSLVALAPALLFSAPAARMEAERRTAHSRPLRQAGPPSNQASGTHLRSTGKGGMTPHQLRATAAAKSRCSRWSSAKT